MEKIKKYIEENESINEFIFCWCICLVIWGLIVGVLFGNKIHFAFFLINLILMLGVSWIKNKKILLIRDIIPLVPILILFIIDYFFRKNNYTFDTYYILIRKCYIPYYFLNRTKNIKEIFRYFSILSKVSIIVFLFDALLDYHFTNNYMTYGFTIMLPAFFSIYFYHFIKKRETDYLYLIISLLGIFVYSNRTCILSVVCLLIFSSKMIIEEIKNRNKTIDKNELKTKLRKNGIVLVLLIFSFCVNYSFLYIEKNHDMILANVRQTFKNIKEDKNEDNDNFQNKSIVTFKSYSLTKYKEATEGKKNTILSGRGKIYKRAIGVIKDDIFSNWSTLLFGKGTGYFRSINNGYYTHNILFDFIIEYGMIGFLFGVSILSYCIFQLFKNYKDKENYMFGIYWLFLAFPRLLLSLYFQGETTFWMFVAFILSCYPIYMKKKLKSNDNN